MNVWGGTYCADIRHGKDGWILEDMDWEPATGLATFEYSNRHTGTTIFRVRPQPHQDGHVEWPVMGMWPHGELLING